MKICARHNSYSFSSECSVTQPSGLGSQMACITVANLKRIVTNEAQLSDHSPIALILRFDQSPKNHRKRGRIYGCECLIFQTPGYTLINYYEGTELADHIVIVSILKTPRDEPLTK